MFVDFKKSMKNEFDMTNLGKMSYFLGSKVSQSSIDIFISQMKYALAILQNFGMCNISCVLNLIVPRSKLMKDEDGIKMDKNYYK